MNAIELHEVSVRYPNQRVTSFKEWAIRAMRADLQRGEFEALHGVSLTVGKGESLGIIGGNGSGKSTVLRVAAGIITPSTGYAVTRGTVAPVIELGTGFDFDLTGRENIFFNGALLGHSRKGLRRTVDEIVEFASLGEFIDAPLRTFSTGMITRLAFSIATRVDADIIMLDEVLAAGDEQFRERSSERIEGFYRGNATVVLVSHDLVSVERLCRKVIWLQNGSIIAAGPTHEVVERYRASVLG